MKSAAELDALDTYNAIDAVAEDPHWPKGLLVAAYSSPRLAFETLRMLCPDLLNYRDCWFIADAFDSTAVDDWFARPGITPAAVELVVNHLHVDGMLFGQPESPPDDIAEAICHMLAFGWRNWAKDRYGLSIVTSVIFNEGSGFEVSFSSHIDRVDVRA